jgi:PAS domain S-box-containing protein
MSKKPRGSTTGLRARLLERTVSDPLADADPATVRDYYQSVMDSIDSVIYTVDRDLRIIGVNTMWDAFALVNGGRHLTREHILGTRLLSQMHGAPLERWRTACQQILSGQIPRYLDEIACEQDFAWRHYTLVAKPLQDSRGTIRGITFVATNITQLKKAENEMLKRLVEIRGLRQVTSAAGVRFDHRGFYKQVTASIAHLFDAEKCIIFRWGKRSGYLEAQAPAFGVAGRGLFDLALDIGDPDDPGSLWQDIEEKDYILLNEGDEAPGSMMETSARVDRLAAMMAMLRVSGRVHGTVLVAGRDRSFSTQDGQLLATFAVPVVLAIEDAESNQRMLERTRQLAIARKELERMTEVAQTVRMPLTVVRSYLELLLDGVSGPVPKEQTTTISMLLDRTREISGLVDQFLPSQSLPDVTRLEPIYLPDLVRRVLDKRSDAIRQTGLEIVTQMPTAEDKEFITVGDPDTLFKVFDALLDHVGRLSPNGGTIQISMHESGEIVYVKIDHPGANIPPQRLLQIWQLQGSGGCPDSIDLAEVKRIVEGHSGHVWAESRPGQGSTFYVALPKWAHT